MRRITLAVLFTLSAGVATAAPHSDEAELAKALAGRTATKTADCVDPSQLGGPQAIGKQTIIYRQSGRRIWRNTLPEVCRWLDPNVTFIIEQYGSRICRDDRFRIVEHGSRIPSPYCRFGSFTAYDKPKR
ncbi:hypothetical protein BH09PSE4_BH09PSE4_22760 [soil metagenome]